MRRPADFAAATAAYQRSCGHGYARGCVGLGRMYARARGVTKDTARATALYERACDAKDELGCKHNRRMHGIRAH